jgi:hypothetical protein
MRAKKPEKLLSTATLMRLAGHAMMGVAMGLCFALTLAFANPSGIAELLRDAGPSVFIGALVTTFGVGAALTGAVFIMTDETGSK